LLARLFNECDDQGIWSPKSLRAMPKATSPLTAHYFPLEDGKEPGTTANGRHGSGWGSSPG